MGKVNPYHQELLSKHFADSIQFDSWYMLNNGKINGESTNTISLTGNVTACICFADTLPMSYIVNVEKNSQVSLYFCYAENANSELHINCLEDSICRHVIMQVSNSSQNIYVLQRKNSVYNAQIFQLGGNNDAIGLHVRKDAENANTHLSGVFFPKDKEKYSIYTKVTHKKPNCETQELFRGIADNMGSGSFSGLIYVAQDAQKTTAHQQNRNILLSPNAHIHSEPQLEIYADDVICNHGSSTGQIDEEALWYMQARGINKATALHMLVSGFANDVLDLIENDSLRGVVSKKISEKLAK